MVGVHSGPNKALILRVNYTLVKKIVTWSKTYRSMQLGKASPTLRMSATYLRLIFQTGRTQIRPFVNIYT